MIEVVINYDPGSNTYKVYESSSDTLLVTASLGESFIKLSEFLLKGGMIKSDILNTNDIVYHLDSYTFQAIIQSNVDLLKRLNTAPSGFMNSSQRFGLGSTSGSTPLPSQRNQSGNYRKGGKNNPGSGSWGNKKKSNNFGGNFSKSSFSDSNRKFWNKRG